MKKIEAARVTRVLVLAGAMASCAEDPAATDDARTLALTLDAFEVGPGEQGLVCQTFENPFGEDVEIERFTSKLDSGGHHALVFAVAGGKDEPLAPCLGNDVSQPMLFQGQSVGEQSMRLPPGVTAVWPADTALRVQIHYLNAEPQPITVRNAIELGLADPGTEAAHVAPIKLENLDISVPPGAARTVEKTCTLARDVDLVWLASHMHSHGVGFEVASGETGLYSSDTWIDPPVRVFDPPLRLAAGAEISFACSYENPTAVEVRLGQSLEDDEMCVVVGGYVTDGESLEQLDCVAPGSGCKSCLEAVIAQSGDEACTDDGAPSSKDAYEAFSACACGKGQGTCAVACAASACAAMQPDEACTACIDATCAVQSADCFGGGAP